MKICSTQEQLVGIFDEAFKDLDFFILTNEENKNVKVKIESIIKNLENENANKVIDMQNFKWQTNGVDKDKEIEFENI